MQQIFENKVVWIIGASSGIGEETARQMNALGSFVVLSARNSDKLKTVQNKLDHASKSLVYPLDLEDQSNFEAAAKEIFDVCGRIDILVNNGGVSQRSDASETTMATDRRIMEINYFGNIAITKAVLPYMQKQKSGHIVVISSIAGSFGFYLRSAYSASKHALKGFYESLLLEEAKNNISVTLVYPGKINTELSISALTGDGKTHGLMDHNQKTGMPVEECVIKMVKAIKRKKKEVFIGNREIWAVYIKRFCPSLFWRIIKNQPPT